MAPLTLYIASISTPSRAVLLAVRNLGVEIELKHFNLMAGEHRRNNDFCKINPRCCVPTLVDHEFILWESKAILIYLAEKYAKNSHALYPKCVKTRAVIHQRLFHDSSDFYVRILDIANLAFSSSSTTTVATVTAQHWENLKKSLLILENFLEGYEYFAGNCMTIADFAYLASISTLVHFGFNLSPYTNVNNWYRRMRDVSGFHECEQGAREFGAIVKGKLTNLFESI